MDESPKEKKDKHGYIYFVPVFLVVTVLIPFVLGAFSVGNRNNVNTSSEPRLKAVVDVAKDTTSEESLDIQINRVDLPDEVRGIYWTAYSAGSQQGKQLLDYMIESGLNTAVIDLKMDNGELAFEPSDEELRVYTQKKLAITDLDGLLKELHEKNIYRIARIPVMRDAAFAKVHPEIALKSASGRFWYDNIGSVWIDPAAGEVSDYAIALAKEAYSRGFDEVQFDYVRFASDGAISAIIYPVYDRIQTKVSIMQEFFKKVGGAMKKEGIPVSFDLFGMTYWSYDDFNIGQRLVDVFPYSDWTSAMVYPSHFPNGFEGYSNPAQTPYPIVKMSMDEGVKRVLGIYAGTEKEVRRSFRPWLQDFDIGAVYTSVLIEDQIRAARDAGASGWILWNARNVYEPSDYLLREKETDVTQ